MGGVGGAYARVTSLEGDWTDCRAGWAERKGKLAQKFLHVFLIKSSINMKNKGKQNCLQLLYLINLFKYLVCIITIN